LISPFDQKRLDHCLARAAAFVLLKSFDPGYDEATIFVDEALAQLI
jgi:hypothetical protein